MSTDSVKMDTGIPLFFLEIEYLLLESIPLETIMRVYWFSGMLQFSKCWKLKWLHNRAAQCIDKEILIRKIRDIDIGIDIDKESFEKLIRY